MQRHVAELLSGLRGRVSHTLAASPEFYNSLPSSAVDGIAFIPTDIGDSVGPRTLAQAVTLARHAKRISSDIVHSHGYKAAVPGVIAAKIARKKSIITGHNLFPADASAAAKSSIRLAARFSDRVIAVAPALAASLAAVGVDKRKIVIIPNGINISTYNGAGDKRVLATLGIDASSPVVLCAARLTEVKGVEHLIRAAALISSRRPDVRVLIAGDGPDRDALVALAEQLAPETVRLIGHRDDMPNLLAAADVVAIPSLAEGHPLILVESMAARKPIVASRVGGLPDVIKDKETGLLVPPADPEALATALLAVIESPELAARLGDSARRYAEKEFTVERMLARTEEVYLCIAS
jgi:glycosyltransferase involved in cell wall biosynthesis